VAILRLLITRLFIPHLSTEPLMLRISGRVGKTMGPRSARRLRWIQRKVKFRCLKQKKRLWLVLIPGVLPVHINFVKLDQEIIVDGRILMDLHPVGLALCRGPHKVLPLAKSALDTGL
jgi:hypothetical protein